MDLNELKKKAKELKWKIVKWTDKIITSSANKIQKSWLTIHSNNELKNLIEKSKNTFYTSSQTWEQVEATKKSIVLIWDPKKDFFKEAIYILPIVATKAFTQSITVKLASSDIDDIDYSEYWVNDFPSMIVFEDTKVYKIITWKLNILKLVKSFSLDINKDIDDFKELEITSINDLKDKVESKANDLRDDIIEKAEEKKEEVKNKIVKKTKELKEEAEEKVRNTKTKVNKKVEEKVKKVKEKIEK